MDVGHSLQSLNPAYGRSTNTSQKEIALSLTELRARDHKPGFGPTTKHEDYENDILLHCLSSLL